MKEEYTRPSSSQPFQEGNANHPSFAHRNHSARFVCGCVTMPTTEPTMCCPCGAEYLYTVVDTIQRFHCYDCGRRLYARSTLGRSL